MLFISTAYIRNECTVDNVLILNTLFIFLVFDDDDDDGADEVAAAMGNFFPVDILVAQ